MNKPKHPKRSHLAKLHERAKQAKRVPVDGAMSAMGAFTPSLGRMLKMFGAALEGDHATMAQGMFDMTREMMGRSVDDVARARFLEAYPLPHPEGCICPVCVEQRTASSR